MPSGATLDENINLACIGKEKFCDFFLFKNIQQKPSMFDNNKNFYCLLNNDLTAISENELNEISRMENHAGIISIKKKSIKMKLYALSRHARCEFF